MLAGGRGARLGGVEKSDLIIDGHTLLEHLLARLEVPVVVVGPSRPIENVTFVLEEPRYGGPVAGLRAAIDLVATPVVGVLAVDLPFAIPVLRDLIGQFNDDMQVLVPVRDGHDQFVCSVFDTSALRHALSKCGDSMRSLFEQVEVSRVGVEGNRAELLQDIDTLEDLKRLQREPGR